MIRRNWKILILILVILVIAGVILFKPKPSIEPPDKIIFMLFDAVRADHLSSYGYVRNTTPVMDKIAADGVLFESVFSQTGWTLPSITSFFTGMYTDFHTTEDMKSILPDELHTLGQYLSWGKYECVGASNNPLISKDRKMNRGIRKWIDAMRDPSLTNYCLSYLNIHDINYFRIWKENHLVDYSFNNLSPNLLKKGKRYNKGNFDRRAWRTSPKLIGPDNIVILSVNYKPINPGRYHWGLALEGSVPEEKVILSLIDPTKPKEKQIIDRREAILTDDWKMYYWELEIKETINNLSFTLSFSSPDSQPDQLVDVDDLFIIPAKKSDINRKRFIYLHYINPHDPHKIPMEIRGKYLELTKDNLLKKQLISETTGDSLDLINIKFVIQRDRFKSWCTLADEINVQNNAYDYEIKYMDIQVKKIVDYLKENGQYDNTLLILTADHGEEFLDHGHVSHTLSLYNELIHIPLIISYPNGLPAGKRIKSKVESIDLLPTLMEITGKDNPLEPHIKKQIQGKSLMPLILGDDKEPSFIFSNDYFTGLTAVIYDKWKLIRRKSDCGTKLALFDIEKDFHETRDVASDNPEIVNMLNGAIEEYKKQAEKYVATNINKKAQDSGAKDADIAKNLAQLGYLNVFYLSRQMKDVYCELTNIRTTLKLLVKLQLGIAM